MGLCYRDRTYCNALDCQTVECGRNITPEVQAAADKWWGQGPGEAPFSIAKFADNCADYRPRAEEIPIVQSH